MSADGDIVRLALHGDEISARAALARLEAAEALLETTAEKCVNAMTQRDALAEAHANALKALDAEEVKLRGWYEECKQEGSHSEASAYGHKIDGINIARAALAEAGLE